MLRLAHTITRLIGGPAYRTTIVMKHTDSSMFEQRLYYGSVSDWDPGEHSYVLDDFPIKTIHIPEMQRNINPTKDLVALMKFIKEFREFKPHIVHAHQSKDGVLARLAALLTGVPIILRSFHGIPYTENYYGKKTPYILPIFIGIEKVFATLTSGDVSTSKILDRDLVERFKVTSYEKTVVVPDAFELEPYLTSKKTNMLAEELGLGENPLIITVVANFIPPKDHNNILEAFSIFLKRNESLNPHLILVGNGPLESQVRQKIKTENLEDRVHLLGHRKDIADIYASSDVGMLGSFIEGTPASLIEAVASGIHVVATDVGGMRDTLDNGRWGTLAAPQNPAALADAIEKELATDRDFETIRHEIARIYDVKYSVKVMEDVYLKLAKEKGLI